MIREAIEALVAGRSPAGAWGVPTFPNLGVGCGLKGDS